MVRWAVIVALMLSSTCTQILAQMSDKEIEGIVQKTFQDKNYSTLEVPPTFDRQPLEVTVEAFVLDVSNMDEKSNTFTVDILLFITWSVKNIYY